MRITKLQGLITITILVPLILIISTLSSRAANPQTNITVSGIVNGPNGSVPNVWIGIGSPQDWQQTTTNASGFYSLNIQTDGELWFSVRPDIATRLTQINLSRDDVTTNITQDFTVTNGYLLDLNLSVGDAWLDAQPLFGSVPNSQWYSVEWQDNTSYRAVLPPDVYYVYARHLPEGYFETVQAFDLSTSDVLADMEINTVFVHPIPEDPPDASKISFGSVDSLGEATLTGTASSVLPLAHVLVVNLNSGHQTHVFSEADGSFTAKIFAPPGSSIMIKHGPPSWRWQGIDSGTQDGGLVTPYASTILYRRHTITGGISQLPFAAAGGIEIDPDSIPTNVGAGWSMEGTVNSSDTLTPGTSVPVQSTIRLYSQAIDASTNLDAINVEGWVALLMLYNGAGQPLLARNETGSNRFTPSGFPILHTEDASWWINTHVTVTDLQLINEHTIEGQAYFTIQLPEDLPYGTYRPVISLNFEGVPTGSEWHAVRQKPFTFWANQAPLPPLTIGPGQLANPDLKNISSRRLVWQILMNNVSQGIRGTGAREDADIYQTSSFIVTQGAPYVMPAVDERTGQPLTYTLEPFLPMISVGDRWVPSPPLIPFDLPGGQLCVTIQAPDHTVRDLGCDTIIQSRSYNETTRVGEDLNSASIQVSDVYNLMATPQRFDITFDQYGHHIITMAGTVNDIWGNSYTGGGTYDVWVAHPLDIDPGVLPGTPLAVGNEFNPTVQLYPRVPARVNLSISHFPDSDPDRAIIYNIGGWANAYGYFSSSVVPLTLNEPGEYRVDLVANYTDPDTDELYMHAATWGGIVMTPAAQAQLVAHGRRGIDNLEYIPNQWFVNCELDPPPPPGSTPHNFNAYFNGDIVWSHDNLDSMNVCKGDALRMVASVQDTAGAIEDAIQERYDRTYVPILPPGNFEDRVLFDELPLFSSTYSGRPIQIVPNDADQIAYAYLSAQRPGVRVRESVAEDGQSSGYWRLGTLYDNQPGVGWAGDLPNDFKFQYTGVVYRDLETGYNEYVGNGSGWIHLPDNDSTGSRVMPPFSGPGNGGWPTQGGPLMRLKGADIHMFILPTGVRPGMFLEMGDTFHFAGHIMPTLNSKVQVIVTDPKGKQYISDGQANHVGYFYNPDDRLTVNEPGLWTVDIQVWHDGQIGSGEQVNCDPNDPFNPALPCPSGNVLGSENGRYMFYVVPEDTPRLEVTSPTPDFLTFDEGEGITPITISGSIPPGLSNVTVDYTISMPGFILEQGQATVNGDTYTLTFDPVTLHESFPNLDLSGRDNWAPGLADTFAFNLLLQGTDGNDTIFQAATITIQGQQVFIEDYLPMPLSHVYLPIVIKGK